MRHRDRVRNARPAFRCNALQAFSARTPVPSHRPIAVQQPARRPVVFFFGLMQRFGTSAVRGGGEPHRGDGRCISSRKSYNEKANQRTFRGGIDERAIQCSSSFGYCGSDLIRAGVQRRRARGRRLIGGWRAARRDRNRSVPGRHAGGAARRARRPGRRHRLVPQRAPRPWSPAGTSLCMVCTNGRSTPTRWTSTSRTWILSIRRATPTTPGATPASRCRRPMKAAGCPGNTPWNWTLTARAAANGSSALPRPVQRTGAGRAFKSGARPMATWVAWRSWPRTANRVAAMDTMNWSSMRATPIPTMRRGRGSARTTRRPWIAQIARAWGFARQSVQRVADVLERDRLVAFAANPDHRRAKLVRLTPRGRTALARIQEAQRAWANALGDDVGEAKLRAANAVLADVLEVLADGTTARGRAER